MNYWLDLFTGTTWDEFRKAGARITGFRSTTKGIAKQVKSGDILAVHPSGMAKARGRFPLSELKPSPRFEEMARTVDGYGERVESPAELPAALKRGLAAVREGRPAILNVLCQRAV
jgi:hypothetical protein